ncbi:S8 family serine peptidase [Mycoplasma sp. 6243]|uniref:S8 family serine peptidase n=1 Tax=Mycoplasma sp. 6243 TaxID=3440865 RepID=UPI003EBFFEAD
MKKQIKKIFLFSSILTTSVASIVTLTATNVLKNQEKPWYLGYQNNKLEVRINKNGQLFNSVRNVPVNNNYELKLLLNYEANNSVMDENLTNQKNDEFIENIKKSNLYFKSYQASSMMPIVWFYFDNENQRKEFLKSIIDKKEIYKGIIFPNEIQNIQLFNTDNLDNEKEEESDVYYNRDITIDNSKDLDIVNFKKQIERENSRYWNKKGNVGVIEVNGSVDLLKLQNFQRYGIEFQDTVKNIEKSHHANEVSNITAGEKGYDRYSKLFFSSFTKNAEWQKTIEWMVKEKGVRVINHSYGMKYDDEWTKYDEDNLFLDYISRKYGVVNIFASGNGNDKKEKENEWLNGYTLSPNNLIVGALDFNEFTQKPTESIAEYSNYLLQNGYISTSKPNVVAPGYLYKRWHKNSKGEWNYLDTLGTSFASPVVTGLVSTLLRERDFLNKDKIRLQSIKAIIGASSRTPKVNNLNYKANGYTQKYGSGIIDFENMLEAADNLVTKEVSKSDNDFVLWTSSFYVPKGKKIKGASSWLFNAGLLETPENSPSYNANVNWWWFLGLLGGVIANSVEGARLSKEKAEWNKYHISEERLNLKTLKQKQDNKMFSDYDLYLEKKDSNGNWNVVKSITSSSSNDELLEYITTEAGYYRLKVKKYSGVLFDNSINDSLALTYTVQEK